MPSAEGRLTEHERVSVLEEWARCAVVHELANEQTMNRLLVVELEDRLVEALELHLSCDAPGQLALEEYNAIGELDDDFGFNQSLRWMARRETEPLMIPAVLRPV